MECKRNVKYLHLHSALERGKIKIQVLNIGKIILWEVLQLDQYGTFLLKFNFAIQPKKMRNYKNY